MNMSTIETRLAALEAALASTVAKDIASILSAAHNIEQYILGGSNQGGPVPVEVVTPIVTPTAVVTVTTSA